MWKLRTRRKTAQPSLWWSLRLRGKQERRKHGSSYARRQGPDTAPRISHTLNTGPGTTGHQGPHSRGTLMLASLYSSSTLPPGFSATQKPSFCPLMGSLCKSSKAAFLGLWPRVLAPPQESRPLFIYRVSPLWTSPYSCNPQPSLSWCDLCRSWGVLGAGPWLPL